MRSNIRMVKRRRFIDEEPVTYYGLFQRGGSIGENANAEYRRYGDGILLEVYLDREEAKAKARRYRKYLTPGERSYYGMGYTVKPLTKSELKNTYVQKLIAELDKGNRFNDSIREVPEENKKALEEFTEWEGIIGYDDDIVDVYESGCAYVDDEYIDYGDSYDALDAYLEWEGILGYTDAIYNILKNGYHSSYYDDMVADRDSYDE